MNDASLDYILRTLFLVDLLINTRTVVDSVLQQNKAVDFGEDRRYRYIHVVFCWL